MHALTAVFLASVAFIGLAHALQCNSTYTWYRWAINHDSQDPCQLVSDLHNSCSPNAYPLQPLSYDPSRINFYPGPNASVQNICTCSYVMYNLMSACGDCQVGLSAPTVWPTYKEWVQSCDISNTGGTYPDALPASIAARIPVWARLTTKESGVPRWSYGLSHAIAYGGASVNTRLEVAASSFCQSHSSPALPIGTAVAGFVAGLLLAIFGIRFYRCRSARVIPPPTRYHTTPDNTPIHPLVPRPAHAQGTNILRRILEHGHENDPRRIEPFDITAAIGAGPFSPHPAAFPAMCGHTFPPAPYMVQSRGPSRQPSSSSLDAHLSTHPTRLRHARSLPYTKPSTRPQTAASRFSSPGSMVPGPSILTFQHSPVTETPTSLTLDHSRLDISEEPPAYRRKS